MMPTFPYLRLAVTVGVLSAFLANTAPLRAGEPTSRRFASDASIIMRQQWSLVSGHTVKIEVRTRGWYAVSWAQLRRAGLSGSVDPARMQLFTAGSQVPTMPSTDRVHRGAHVAFEFFAAGLDTPEADTQTFWLRSDSSEKAIKRVSPKPSSAAPPVSFTDSVSLPEHVTYYASAPPGRPDGFYGPVLQGKTVTQSVTLGHVVTGSRSSARIDVSLQGLGTGHHGVSVSVNGNSVGRLSFDGTEAPDETFAIPSGLAHSGKNEVSFVPSGASTDVSLIGSVHISYPHAFTLSRSTLLAHMSGGQAVRISGGTHTIRRLLDVTDPTSPELLIPHHFHPGDRTTGTFVVPGSGARKILAVSLPLRTAYVMANTPSHWHLADKGADLVILAYRPFMSDLQPLVTTRRAEGLTVDLIDVQNIIDEFGFGIHGPDAVRSFLEWAAAHWIHPPRYVLLAGDGSYDPRNYLKEGFTDFVPAKLIAGAGVQAASDEWFVDFKGDGIPQIPIGRIPAKTAAEMQTAVTKIVAYRPNNQTRQAVLVAGHNHPDDGLSFASENAALAKQLSGSIATLPIVEDESDTPTTTSQIVHAIDAGPMFVNFLGHGSINLWANLLQNSDVSALTNGTKLPIFVMMTCLNGYYIDPSLESLAQTLLFAPNGGAVGVWSSTGETAPFGQAQMNLALYHQIFDNQVERIGDSVKAAAEATSDPSVRQTWVYVGDPSMVVDTR